MAGEGNDISTGGTSGPVQAPTAGEHGDACVTCGAPLAGDQRYCLNCGQRRGPNRVELSAYLDKAAQPNVNAAQPNGSVPNAAPAPRPSEPSPWAAVMGVGLLGVMLLIGVLIGRGSEDDPPAPVVQVEGAGTETADSGDGSSETVTDGGEVQTDWPPGETGWTIELGALPKDGTTAADLDAAKANAESTGASDVGVLDSDQYASLPGGSYVIYSGVYSSGSDAKAALGDLEAAVPDAQVIEVSDEEASADSGGGADALEIPEELPEPEGDEPGSGSDER